MAAMPWLQPVIKRAEKETGPMGLIYPPRSYFDGGNAVEAVLAIVVILKTETGHGLNSGPGDLFLGIEISVA